MEPEGSIPNSQVLSISPYPEPDQPRYVQKLIMAVIFASEKAEVSLRARLCAGHRFSDLLCSFPRIFRGLLADDP
jgi:hypothetical protein